MKHTTSTTYTRENGKQSTTARHEIVLLPGEVIAAVRAHLLGDTYVPGNATLGLNGGSLIVRWDDGEVTR